jgi:signal transduction histidine kinase
MRSQILQRSLTDPEQLRMLAELEETMQLSISRLRQVADDLAPPTLGHDRLAAASPADSRQLARLRWPTSVRSGAPSQMRGPTPPRR